MYFLGQFGLLGTFVVLSRLLFDQNSSIFVRIRDPSGSDRRPRSPLKWSFLAERSVHDREAKVHYEPPEWTSPYQILAFGKQMDARERNMDSVALCTAQDILLSLSGPIFRSDKANQIIPIMISCLLILDLGKVIIKSKNLVICKSDSILNFFTWRAVSRRSRYIVVHVEWKKKKYLKAFGSSGD